VPDLSKPAGEVTHLWQTQGTYELAATAYPDGFEPLVPIVLPLTPEPIEDPTSDVTAWSTTSPYVTQTDDKRGGPPAFTVQLGDKTLTYARGATGSTAPYTWKIKGKQLIITTPAELTPETANVSWKRLAPFFERHNPEISDDPFAFTSYDLTLGRQTRQGLLLTGESVAEWTVTVPEDGAEFNAWVALEPVPLLEQPTDGGTVFLEVVSGDTTRQAGRTTLKAASESFAHWRVKLSKWAGQEVTLRLRTASGDANIFDYFFVGAPSISGEAALPPRRVVVIGLDTTRPDHFSYFGYDRETTPEFDAVLRQSAVFPNAWTSAPRTRPSFRSAATGRNPLDAVGAETIGTVLSNHGFATAGFAANVHLQPRFDFSDGFDDWTYAPGATADEQVDRALAFFKARGNRDAFVFLHIMDPHIFYNAPGAFRDMWVTDPDGALPPKFNRWEVYDMDNRGLLSDQRKAHIEALYDGEMSFMSRELARFFDSLDRLGGRNLVVVHNDHGEEFWEHGGFEHNHTLYQDTTAAIFAIRGGIGAESANRQFDAPVTLQDIAPTLFDFTQIPLDARPDTDGRSLRPMLEGAEGWGQERPIGIAHLRYGKDRWGVVLQQHKYILHTGSGEEEFYDLGSDPGEQQNMIEDAPELAPWRAALGEAHNAQVSSGWRIKGNLTMKAGEVLTVNLPRAATHAGIIDPEHTIPNPKNQAWGEPPRRTVDEIGTIALAEDGLSFTWTVGERPRDATLYVLFENGEDLSVQGTFMFARDEKRLVKKDALGRWRWRNPQGALTITEGTVLVPPIGEAARMRALSQGTASGEDEAIEMLRAMGYIHDH
jgi:arylsulfatase A-like enzyme